MSGSSGIELIDEVCTKMIKISLELTKSEPWVGNKCSMHQKDRFFCEDFEKPALFAKYLPTKTESINNYILSSKIFLVLFSLHNKQSSNGNDALQKNMEI